MDGFVRVGAAVPECSVADPQANASRIVALCELGNREGSAVTVFPELCLTGYTARDLFFDQQLYATSQSALATIAEATKALASVVIVGAPVQFKGRLFNCAVAIQNGRLLAVVPKSFLPNTREFEEKRWFHAGTTVADGETLVLAGQTVPFGTDLLLCADSDNDELIVGICICEDEWVPLPPSAFLATAGATVICNLSASNFLIGKAENRRSLVQSATERGKCAYIYVGAGPGESSTDLAFDADAFIFENGKELASSERFLRDSQLVTADVNLERLLHDRLTTNAFGDCAALQKRNYRRIPFQWCGRVASPLRRKIDPHPFLPKDPKTLAMRCWETFEIQTNALVTRMSAVGTKRLVLGISGGLDSTHAALVCIAALDAIGAPHSNLLCLTMPGLGTTVGTKQNATTLAEALGVTFKESDISQLTFEALAAVQHEATADAKSLQELLARLRQDPKLGDTALENAQARLRTLLLMTEANQTGALVVGTGDLSEKALGWSTYAGDQISMYDVNSGVPKTLIQFVIRWVANERAHLWSQGDTAALRETLFSILDTPISPELLPASADGQIAQLTESAIGPYELHDFFLYHVVRHGTRPRQLLGLAQIAFGDRYTEDEQRHWLSVFYRRFFANQFKRSCTPDAPKVGSVSLSPRGDWRMPSDAQVATWLAELEKPI